MLSGILLRFLLYGLSGQANVRLYPLVHCTLYEGEPSGHVLSCTVVQELWGWVELFAAVPFCPKPCVPFVAFEMFWGKREFAVWPAIAVQPKSNRQDAIKTAAAKAVAIAGKKGMSCFLSARLSAVGRMHIK